MGAHASLRLFARDISLSSNRRTEHIGMGRLFWKFFAFLWLAQVFTVICVGLTMWTIGSYQNQPEDIPPARGERHLPYPQPPDALMMWEPPQDNLRMDGPRDRQPHRPPPWLPPLIVGSLVSLLFAALLARYFSRPIRALRHAFDATANGHLDTRIGQTIEYRHDELSDLGAYFDRMAERLQKLIESKQRLLHDVSHELRSPLARLQAVLDLMQQQPDRTEELLERIERESNRIDKLVGELLTLARLDNDFPGIQAMELDLNEVIEAIAEDASFEAETKQCRVNLQLPDKICINGYPELLHRAIENIVRNAIRHTPSGSSISITGETDSEQKWLYLHIMDEGEGVPESDLNLLFEPFFRSTTADQFQGYGMGMAITQRVAEAHGGKVTARNRDEGGLAVTLELPLSSEDDG